LEGDFCGRCCFGRDLEGAKLAAKAMGLKVAGVDLLRSKTGPLVLEVNSSPGLEGIETATGVNVAGKIIDFDLDFIFRVGETNGVYINCETVKVDQDFDSMIQKLRQYYEKFKSKWGKIIASRKKTD
jgi:hypothetical protein